MRVLVGWNYCCSDVVRGRRVEQMWAGWAQLSITLKIWSLFASFLCATDLVEALTRLRVFDGLPSTRPHPSRLISDVYRIPPRSIKEDGRINC